MADWIGKAMTNAVAIRDMDGLVTALAPWNVEVVSDPDRPNRVAFASTEASGGWPSFEFDEEGNEVEFSFALISPFMEPGQVLVTMEVGGEPGSYVSAIAEAFNAAGDKVVLDLDMIYALAAQTFRVPPETVSRCVG